MHKNEERFWKFVTWFGDLPGIFLPVGLVIWITTGTIYYNAGLHQDTASLIWTYHSLITASLLVCLGIFMSYAIGTIIKYLYYKPRPIPRDTTTTWKRINAGSMPSIHTSNGLITAIALIMIAFHNGPYGGRENFVIVMIGLLYYLCIALSRIALQKHYPIDVLAGTVLGIIITTFILIANDYIIATIESIIKLFL